MNTTNTIIYIAIWIVAFIILVMPIIGVIIGLTKKKWKFLIITLIVIVLILLLMMAAVIIPMILSI